ncbi:MAG: glycosyltransferase family 39 protein [Candidatus Limnocylindrales bacterium]
MARRPGIVLLVVAVAGCLAGLVAGVRSGPLWLDETLSVEIARVPLGSLVEALRVDGAPPVYYLLLKGWMAVVGDGTVGVRILTVLMVPVALLLAYRVGLRLGDVGAARGAVIALAVLPWTMRYGSETRMYLLVVVLVLALALAVESLHRSGSRRALAAVAALSGLLLLTNYWGFFLLAAVGLGFLLPAVRGSVPARRVVLGLVLGGVLFLPWLPVFLFQLAHTGAPWADPLEPVELLRTPRYWGGGSDVARGVFGVLVVALAGWAAWRVGVARRLVLVAGLTLLLAWTSVLLGGGAYTGRYTAVAVPLVAVAIGLGVGSARWGLPALALLTAVGLASGIPAAGTSRSSADGVVAAFSRAGGAPGDLLAYCPDQLGPPVWRLLDRGVEQVVYPTLGDPRRVDWVDYAERQAAADPTALARRLSGLAGDRQLFVLSATEYRTFGGQCEELLATLTSLRGDPELLFGRAGTTGQLLHRFPTPP